MVKFKDLGFVNFKEYEEYFFNKLLLSNKTYEYFVDWKKAKEDAKKYLYELSLLNSLTKISAAERESRLQDLILYCPKVVEVLPVLIAERVMNNKIDIFDPTVENYISYEFNRSNVDEQDAQNIAKFCSKTGIMDLFQEVKDLYDYLLGVEVGLDTNARKNRSGKIFERMCREKIRRLVGPPYKIVNNDPNFSLYTALTIRKRKTHDMVIYKNNKPILVVECNFYNVTGSKPISIAESYIDLNNKAKQQNIKFLWVTDGPAWLGMEGQLISSMQEIDYVLNYKMLDRITNILSKV